jgi:hypothetical protein
MDETIISVGTLPKTLDELYNDLLIARTDFENVPTYYNAVRVQYAERLYDKMVDESRDTYFILEGSNGLHDRTPSVIMADALREIVSRAEALELEYSHIDFGGDGRFKPFSSLYQVAKNALKDSGNA